MSPRPDQTLNPVKEGGVSNYFFFRFLSLDANPDVPTLEQRA